MPRTPISTAEHPRAYPLLWGGTASANLADGVALAAAPLLAAALTRDPALVSGLVVAQRLPWFLFVLFSGVIVDRFDRRMLLVLGNALRIVALGGVTLGLVLGVRELWMLYVAAFLVGTAETVVDNASLAILPSLVRRDRMSDANGRLFATQAILNELVGPPLGALIFSLSAVAAFATGSAAYLLAVVVFFLLPRRVRAADEVVAPPQPVLPALREGLRWFRKSRLLITFATLAGVINFSTAAVLAILVLFTQDRLGLDAAGYGLLLAVEALGGIPAGLLASAIIRRLGEAAVMILSTLSAGLGYLAIALFENVWVVGAVMIIVGFGFTLGNVVAITVRQTIVPDGMLGRVTSVYRLIAIGAAPIGALAGGLLARAFGLAAPFWAAGALMTLLALVVAPLFWRMDIPRTGRVTPALDPEPGDSISKE
jgi:MFS family permease